MDVVCGSLTGTALARTKITTGREKRLVESVLFEPLLANLLAFVKAYQEDQIVSTSLLKIVVLFFLRLSRENTRLSICQYQSLERIQS